MSTSEWGETHPSIDVFVTDAATSVVRHYGCIGYVVRVTQPRSRFPASVGGLGVGPSGHGVPDDDPGQQTQPSPGRISRDANVHRRHRLRSSTVRDSLPGNVHSRRDSGSRRCTPPVVWYLNRPCREHRTRSCRRLRRFRIDRLGLDEDCALRPGGDRHPSIDVFRSWGWMGGADSRGGRSIERSPRRIFPICVLVNWS